MPGKASPLLVTPRLSIHRLSSADADFIFELLNEPSFLRFIGDKRVRNAEDACKYLEDGPLSDYREYGYGAYLVRHRDRGDPAGICGFYQRANLDIPDLGFAFLRRFWGQGYAEESSKALLNYARDSLTLTHIAAIVDTENYRSVRLIEALGFEADGYFQLPDDQDALRLYRLSLTAAWAAGIC